jgi:hypothetical protein
MTNKQKIKIPLPQQITEYHPDFPYWQGLCDDLGMGLADNLIDKEEVKYYYLKFAKLTDEDEKRKFLLKLHRGLNEIREKHDILNITYDQIDLKDKIEEYVNYFPSNVHDAVYSFIMTGEVPYEEFFDDVTLSLKLAKETGNINYSDLDPYEVVEELKLNSLRLDEQNSKVKARNTKPLTQTDIDEILNSTESIKKELDNTPEYGYNPLTNNSELKNAKVFQAGTNIDINLANIKRQINNSAVQPVPNKPISKTASLTDALLKGQHLKPQSTTPKSISLTDKMINNPNLYQNNN